MALHYTLRPLSDTTWLRPDSARQYSRFTAHWSDTLALLERELVKLRAELQVEAEIEEHKAALRRLRGGKD